MFDDAAPGMIQDPVHILAYLAAVVGVVFQLGRLEALRPLFDRLPPLVWAYFLPMLSTTAGILPDESAVYRALARYLLPASLVLMLLSADIKAVARLGRTALLVMAAGVAGIVLGVVAAYFVFRPWLPPDAWKAVGALAGTWIGGSANLLAVGTDPGLSPELQGVIIVVDTVVGYTWMGVLISLAGHQERFDRWIGADRSRIADVSARASRERAARARPPGVADVTLLVGLALVAHRGLPRGGRAAPAGRARPERLLVGHRPPDHGRAPPLADAAGRLEEVGRLHARVRRLLPAAGLGGRAGRPAQGRLLPAIRAAGRDRHRRPRGRALRSPCA